MRAIQIHRFGGPEVLELHNIPVPNPADDEVLVKMAYAGINFTDIYRRSGHYAESPTYPTPLPYVLGIEGSGIVAKVGSKVTGFAVGDRVAYTRNPGSYAEYNIAPAHRLVRVPKAVGLDVASAVVTHGMTAHYLAHEFGLQAGSFCLVHAGAGGVGQMLIQIARMRGARVIATVSTEEKARVARERGADHVIVYTKQRFPDIVHELTAGRGVDVVFDSVGRDTLRDSLYSLRRRGICVLYGHASGIVDNFNTMELAEAGSVFLTRPHMAHYVATPEEYAHRANDVMKWIAEGRLRVTIQHVFDLADAANAHAVLAGRGSIGKLILKIAADIS